MKRILTVGLFLCFSMIGIYAEVLEPGSIKGCIIEISTGSPLELANITIKNKKDSVILQSVTDKNGQFVIKGFSTGTYMLRYSFIGYNKS